MLLRVAPAFVPPGLLPAAVPLVFDGRMLAFCVAAVSVVAIVFGVAPAWRATGATFVQAASADSRTSTGRTGFRGLVATVEVAIAVSLLCGAGLLLRTLAALTSVDSGAGARNVLTMTVSPGMSNDEHYLRRYTTMPSSGRSGAWPV